MTDFTTDFLAGLDRDWKKPCKAIEVDFLGGESLCQSQGLQYYPFCKKHWGQLPKNAKDVVRLAFKSYWSISQTVNQIHWQAVAATALAQEILASQPDPSQLTSQLVEPPLVDHLGRLLVK